MKEQFSEAMVKQREFLHDLSNQILIAHGMASSALVLLNKEANVDPKIIERLEKSIKASDKIVSSLTKQRELVIQSQQDNGLV